MYSTHRRGRQRRVDLTDIGRQTKEQEQAMVVAIVNTLTEFPSINNVSITIDGKEKKTLSNGTDISKPMESFALNIEDGEVPVSAKPTPLRCTSLIRLPA